MNPIAGKSPFPTEPKPADRGRLRKIALLFLRDAAALLSAPFRVRKKSLLRAASVLAAILVVMPFDGVIIENTRVPLDNAGGKALRQVEKMGMNRVVLSLAALAMASGYLASVPVLLEVGTLAFQTQVFTNLFNSGLKGLFGRRRPPDAATPADFQPFSFARGSKNSMPSAHAAHAFGFATAVLMAAGRRWGGAAYGLAGLVGVSRVLHGQHYLTDVMVGAALGVFVGRTLGLRHRREKG